MLTTLQQGSFNSLQNNNGCRTIHLIAYPFIKLPTTFGDDDKGPLINLWTVIFMYVCLQSEELVPPDEIRKIKNEAYPYSSSRLVYPWPYKSGWKINPPITFASLFDESFQISPTQCQNIKLINNFIARP